MKGLLLATVLLGAVSQGALAARWFDSLPADDPDTVVRPGEPPLPLPAPQTPASLPLSVAHQTAAAAVGIVGTVVGGLQSFASGTREALWETAYMFGINSTKMPEQPVHDPLPDMQERSSDSAPVRFSKTTPAVQVATASPVPVASSPAAAPPPTPPVIAAAATPAVSVSGDPSAVPPKDIDPGLLGNFIFDRGDRRPDGSYFVPKPLQRLFEVRTARVTTEEVPVTVKLAGRIMADPQHEGDVEASILGRIEPPATGLPVLGDTVHQGQVLGYVVPAVGVVDRTNVRSQIARLTTLIRVETENLEILKHFSFVPFRDGKIYESQQRLDGLRRERAALLPLLQTQEALLAPTDGVISVSTAIAGRIVNPAELVYEIVNPKMLWVEASAPDPSIAQNAQRVAKATAITPEGHVLSLTYVGSGLALQQQSTPIMFRIDNPPGGLRVGRPVTVTVQSQDRSETGFPLTRDALAIGADGVQEVWEQTAPEVFEPHAVQVRDLDGSNVLITSGLKQGSHVVVGGVRLLAQLQ
jgi:cobalt-zinc-cadmium efflux system membrane fusion protein